MEDWKRRLYPDVPQPPLSWPLTLHACEGTYANAGYGDLELRFVRNVDDTGSERLGAMLQTSSAMGFDGLTYHLDLHHVSGTFWLGLAIVEEHLPRSKNRRAQPELCVRAEFRLGLDSQVQQLGLDLRQESTSGPLVWFRKM